MKERARENKAGEWKSFLIAGCVSTAFFCLLHFCVSPVFAINDDVMIESVLSGSYLRPYPYAYYFSAELGWILAGLYGLMPGIPWFGLFYAGCHVLCMTALVSFALRVMRKSTATKMLFAVLGVICCMTALCFQEFVLMHYTVLAAMLGATGLFLFAMAKDYREVSLPVILFLLCYLVRENVFFMLLPFIAIAFCYVLSENGWKTWKSYAPRTIAFFLAFVALFTINRSALRGEEWENYLEYNEVRTNLFDYLGIHNEEEALIQYEKENVSRQEIEIIKSYDLALLEDGTGNVRAMKAAEAYGKASQDAPASRLVWAAKTYLHRFLLQRDDFPYNLLSGAAFLGLLFWYFVKKKRMALLMLVGLIAYRSAFWIFLLYKGRYPERVINSLYLMELCFLLAMILRELLDGEFTRARQAFVAALTIVFTCMVILGVKETRQAYRVQVAENGEGDALIDYMQDRSGNFYFLDVYALVGRTKPVFAVAGDENYLWMGGWMTRHPLYLEKLAKRFDGVDNAKAALRKEKTYLVLKEGVGASKEQMEDWLGMTLIQTDVLECGASRYVILQTEK